MRQTAPLSRAVSADFSILTAMSDATDARTAALDIWQQLQPDGAACVIFFCSPDYELKALSDAFNQVFDGIPMVGCTTAGEISQRGMSQGSITAFSLPLEEFAVQTILLNNLAEFSAEQAFEAVRDKLELLEQKSIAPVSGHSFALSLLDGMSIREEVVLQAINDALDGIPLLGGSAGDNLNFGDTYVYFQGRFYNNAAVMILVNTVCPFEVVSSHHFVASSEKLVVTKADPVKRVAIELNAEPAALEYCRIVGVSLDELSPSTFALHPLAVQVGGNLYIRSIQQVNDDLSLTFFCAIDTGIVLTRMEDGGMIDHFNAMMLDVIDQVGEPQLIIGCDCIHRFIEADKKDLSGELSRLYQRYRVTGFNTYGEQRNGLHLNHSFTGVAIGRSEP